MVDHDVETYRRPGRGILAGLGVLALVAVPAAGTAYLAALSFLGCLLECGDRAPGRGLLWSGVTAVLLAVPVTVGLLVARVPLRRALPWLLVVLLAAAVGALLLQRAA